MNTRLTIGSLLACATVFAAVTACVKPDLAHRYTPAWEAFDATEPGWIATRPALLVSDCQMHNLLSLPVPDRNLSIEAVAATAIRPPQLDLFSGDVLQWILENDADDVDVIIHLGDALDLACTGEFDHFLRVIGHAKRPWFMTPGNHDMYYLGSYDPEDETVWKDACYEAGRLLTKDHFIRLYVAALLLQQSDEGFARLRKALGITPGPADTVHTLAERIPDEFEWNDVDDDVGLLEGICWVIDPARPWRSYILQRVDFSPRGNLGFHVEGLLMDSCQYGRRPELIPNAWQCYPLRLNCGFSGEMLPNQMRKIREWADAARKRNTLFVAACHHPFADFAPRTKSSFGYLWREYRVSMMVSGHTHKGYFAHHNVGGEREELELNLASTTDWPMEWRMLQGFIRPEREQIYIQAKRRTLVQVLANKKGYFQPGWEVPLDAPDDYRKYKIGEPAASLLFDFYLAYHMTPNWLSQPVVRANAAARHTEEQVKDTLLWTYHRLTRTFPTDPASNPMWPGGCTDDASVLALIAKTAERKEAIKDKIHLLRQLAEFERTRKTRDTKTGKSTDDVRMRFKISQAAWAARFEAERGRRLRVEDELIRVRWDPENARANRDRLLRNKH